MKSVNDQFSEQAETYQKYRPHYPPALYRALLDEVPQRRCCWDCGTGNGQVANVLAQHFDRVYATDISAQQLQRAAAHERIEYRVERAERTQFRDEQFDLITVGQALHWFDFEAFGREVERVAQAGAILGVWGYQLLRSGPDLDPVIDHFYQDIIGPYWSPERRHVDEAYRSLPLPGKALPSPTDLHIHVEWPLAALEGYFRSWSSVRQYRRQHDDDPVAALMERIRAHWGSTANRSFYFPLFVRLQSIKG
ncbi:MAG: class I SAM-dependent methyltransferase [Bacteroidota bacterium]